MIDKKEFISLRVGDRVTLEARVIETPQHDLDLVTVIFDHPVTTLGDGKVMTPRGEIVTTRPRPPVIGDAVTWGAGEFSYELIAIREAFGVKVGVLWDGSSGATTRGIADLRVFEGPMETAAVERAAP